MTIEVRLERRPAQRVAFVRHVGAYSSVGTAWQTLIGWAGRRGLFMRGPVKMVGVCHDDPGSVPSESLRYDACIVVGDDAEAEDEVGVQELEGGEFVTAVHTGPYAMLHATYAALAGGCFAACGRRLADAPALEEYLNDPRTTPEAALRTKIWRRLADA